MHFQRRIRDALQVTQIELSCLVCSRTHFCLLRIANRSKPSPKRDETFVTDFQTKVWRSDGEEEPILLRRQANPKTTQIREGASALTQFPGGNEGLAAASPNPC